MAFSRSAHISRYKKDIDPVTDVTLILVGLSTSAKTQVANQILHHLKGCAADTNAESEPIPECKCQVQEGKVLGLKVTTVNTPDVPEEEVEDIRTLGNEMKEFAIGDYVIVMVMAAVSPDGGIDREKLLRFNDMTFGNQSHRYSLAILTSEAIEMDQRSHKEKNRTGKDASIQETICSQEILAMTFDLGASKVHNDKQVQVLFNHAKTLVRRKREDLLTKANEDETDVTGSHNLPVTNGGGEANSCATTTSSSAQDQHQSEFELTTDSLRPEEIKELDVCIEVFEHNLPSSEEQRGEHRYQVVLEDREHNPGNISFVTANPIACGDFQC